MAIFNLGRKVLPDNWWRSQSASGLVRDLHIHFFSILNITPYVIFIHVSSYCFHMRRSTPSNIHSSIHNLSRHLSHESSFSFLLPCSFKFTGLTVQCDLIIQLFTYSGDVVAKWLRAGLVVNRWNDQSCTWSITRTKIHLINLGCFRQNITLQCSLKHHLFVHLLHHISASTFN